jgi:hypothetical protein
MQIQKRKTNDAYSAKRHTYADAMEGYEGEEVIIYRMRCG